MLEEKQDKKTSVGVDDDQSWRRCAEKWLALLPADWQTKGAVVVVHGKTKSGKTHIVKELLHAMKLGAHNDVAVATALVHEWSNVARGNRFRTIHNLERARLPIRHKPKPRAIVVDEAFGHLPILGIARSGLRLSARLVNEAEAEEIDWASLPTVWFLVTRNVSALPIWIRTAKEGVVYLTRDIPGKPLNFANVLKVTTPGGDGDTVSMCDRMAETCVCELPAPTYQGILSYLFSGMW